MRECTHIGHGCHHRLEKGIRLDCGWTRICGCGTCDGRIDGQDVRLSAQQSGRLFEDIERMLLLEASLAIEVIFEERNVGLALLRL